MTDPVAELASWVPPDGTQASLRAAFLAHASEHADATDRRCRPDHLTASVLVMNRDGSRVLLGLHRKVGLWLQFGGHIEPADASLRAAGLREAQEESGIAALSLVGDQPVQLDRHTAPCAPDARNHLDMEFLAIADDAAVPRVSDESIDVRWFASDSLPNDTDQAVRRMVAASRQLLVQAL